jgi:hypothetical protein
VIVRITAAVTLLVAGVLLGFAGYTRTEHGTLVSGTFSCRPQAWWRAGERRGLALGRRARVDAVE